MRVITTDNLAGELRDAPDDVHLWIYNGFDVMVPHEVLECVDKKMTETERLFYAFEKNLQGPAISMMLTGVKVDQNYLHQVLQEHFEQYAELSAYVTKLALAVWGDDLNVRSPDQMKAFFYSEDGFNFPPKYTGVGRKRRVTCERVALEKLAQENYYARPVINAILCLKDTGKAIEFLERGTESDGRVHCSFNVAATESGRWSSSHNPWGRGGNFQNQTESIRRIYVSDTGYIFAYPDLSQAEAYGVAYYSGDPLYLAAVNTGDIHTQVSKFVWPELNWEGDDGPRDRAVAEASYYRHLTYRDLAKRGAHGSNYGGQAWTLARHLQVPTGKAEEFQDRYFTAFPGIRGWHREVQRELQSTGQLTTPLGRKRTFFGRLDSRETLKEALAWQPQCLISDILKIGTLYAWRHFQLARQWIKVLADMHDGNLLLVKCLHLDEAVPHLKRLYTIPVQFPTGVMTIPVDFTVGFRWQKKEMREWEPGILSHMTRPEPTDDLLALEASLVQKAR